MKFKRVIAGIAVMASGVMCLAGCSDKNVASGYEQISQEEAKKNNGY